MNDFLTPQEFIELLEKLKADNSALQDKYDKCLEVLTSIAANDALPSNIEEFFKTLNKYELIKVVTQDTQLARDVLKECGE